MPVSPLVATTEIWVLPLLNPDGFEAFTRFNASGFDLNRSFPDGGESGLGNPVFGPLPPLAGGPPEVLHMMRFSTERNFTLAVNFHTGSLVVNYPYDDDNLGSVDSPSPDDALFKSVARAYSSQNGPMWASAYFPQGIVNGAAWYTMDGGMQDWHYRYAGANEVTIELSDTKRPLPSQIPPFWNDNREAMLRFIESVHTGVQGQITDATTGQPVHAALKALGVEHPVFNDPTAGDYHRMFLLGTYHLLFTAPGYETRIYSNVVVQAGQVTRLDVALHRLDRPPERILMVTCESLRPGLELLKTRKQAEGFAVQEYVVADGTPAGRIRTVLRDVFTVFPAEYVLLIGNLAQIPINSDANAGDLFYALMDAGETPAQYLGKDAILGRLGLDTNPAIAEYVQKLAAFAAARSHRSKDLTWISHGYDAGQFQLAEQTHEWCITNFVPNAYYHTRFYQTNGSAGELTAHINAGTDGVIYSGHGFVTYWVRFHYDQSALAGLSNISSVPIVFAHACQTAGFGGVGDAWLQTAARAVAYVGSRFDTFWEEDDCLQKAEFAAMRATTQLSVGKALDHALLQVQHEYPERAENYWKGYRIAGDPTVVLLDGLPQPLSIQTAGALSPANIGVSYQGLLEAQGGTAPLTWRLVDGPLPAGLSLSSSGRLTGTPCQTGTSHFTLQVQDASEPPQQVSLACTLVVLDFNDMLNAAVDTTNLLWNYGGSALWHSQTNVTHDGMDAAESGTIADGQQSWMETTIEGPGIVSFWWKDSSEQSRDGAHFYVNNQWSG